MQKSIKISFADEIFAQPNLFLRTQQQMLRPILNNYFLSMIIHYALFSSAEVYVYTTFAIWNSFSVLTFSCPICPEEAAFPSV